MEGNAAEIERTEGLGGVIRDDPDHLHVELADPQPVQQVDQAMIEFRHQDEHPLPLAPRGAAVSAMP